MLSRSKPVVFLATLMVIGVVIAALIIPTACAPKQQRTLKMLGSSAGSKTNMGFDYMAKVVSEETDIVAGNLPGQETDNYDMLEKGEGDIMYMDILKGSQAYAGTGPFQGKPHKNLRSVMGMTTQLLACAVLADSKITKIEDLLGKRVAFGTVGTQSETYTKILFDIGYGLTKEKMQAAGGTIANLSFGDMGTALTDKTIDCVNLGHSAGMLDPNLQAAEALGSGIRLLSPSQETIDKVRKVYPGYPTGYIKGGLYKNNPQDVFTVAYPSIIGTQAGVPDDVIYDFLKVVQKKQHRDAIYNMVRWVEFSEGSIAGIDAIPIHPGAAKWLRDNGYNISGMKVGG